MIFRSDFDFDHSGSRLGSLAAPMRRAAEGVGRLLDLNVNDVVVFLSDPTLPREFTAATAPKGWVVPSDAICTMVSSYIVAMDDDVRRLTDDGTPVLYLLRAWRVEEDLPADQLLSAVHEALRTSYLGRTVSLREAHELRGDPCDPCDPSAGIADHVVHTPLPLAILLEELGRDPQITIVRELKPVIRGTSALVGGQQWARAVPLAVAEVKIGGNGGQTAILVGAQ